MELRSECRPPDIEAAKTISKRCSIDQHVGLMAHFCEPALHQHHAYWNITQQEVIHIPPSCQVPPMALKCCQKMPLHSGLKITFYLLPFETCCQPFNLSSSLAHISLPVSFKLGETDLVWGSRNLRVSVSTSYLLMTFLLFCVHFLTRYFTVWLACCC